MEWILWIGFFLCGFVAGVLVDILVHRREMQNKESKINELKKCINEKTQLCENFQGTYHELWDKFCDSEQSCNELKREVLDLQAQLNSADKIEDVSKNVEYLEELANERRALIDKMSAQFEGYKNQVDLKMAEKESLEQQIIESDKLLSDLIEKVASKQDEFKKIAAQCKEINEESANVAAQYKQSLIRAAKENGIGYSLDFDEKELKELRELEEIMGRLSRPAVLAKAIYDIYYAGKMKSLIGTAQVNGVCGIYRIWHVVKVDRNGSEINDHEKFTSSAIDLGQYSEVQFIERNYIGQSVNLGDRWIQHLKRAVGVDDTAAIKLYPAMKKYGIENFRWELVEVCEKEKLGEREKYWAEFYACKETGYNIKAG